MFGTAAGKTFHFSVIDKYGFQHKASAKAPSSITAGQITRATPKAKDGEYIEFDEVKWAKGNLLWDNGTLTQSVLQSNRYFINASYLTMTSYFIAPSQEWSPAQLNSTLVNFPVWPVAPPDINSVEKPWFGVPNPTTTDGYYSLFYLAAAGKHGEMSARGRNVSAGSNPTAAGTLLAIPTSNFSEDIDYAGRLWSDQPMLVPIDVHTAYIQDINQYVRGYYFGDLATLVTDGDYRMPKYQELEVLFNHPNAVWGVYFIDKGSNMKMRYGNTKTGDGSKMPIYGIYINKHQKPTTATHQFYVGSEKYKGQAFVLSADDLKKGVFLPADGIRKQTMGAGTLNYTSDYYPGQYCSYFCSYFGRGALGSYNGRHWIARPSNKNGTNQGMATVGYSSETRTTAGSIRPIFTGNPFE